MMMTLPFVIGMVLISIVIVPIVAFYFYCMYKLFEKCDVDGWRGLIPFYNTFIEIRLFGLNWWYILLYVGAVILSVDAGTGLKLLCSIVLFFVHSLICYNAVKKVNNGKNQLAVDFVLLTFIPIVYLPVMALNSDYKYNKDAKVTLNAYIDEIQTSDFDLHKTKEENVCKKCGAKVDKNNKYCPECGKKI